MIGAGLPLGLLLRNQHVVTDKATVQPSITRHLVLFRGAARLRPAASRNVGGEDGGECALLSLRFHASLPALATCEEANSTTDPAVESAGASSANSARPSSNESSLRGAPTPGSRCSAPGLGRRPGMTIYPQISRLMFSYQPWAKRASWRRNSASAPVGLRPPEPLILMILPPS